ncbi:transposase [Arthrobacter sp. Sr24]
MPANKVWVTDFTYVPFRGGFAYVSFVIDLFSRRILSWASSTSHDTAFAEEALQLALWQRRNERHPHVRPVVGTVHHSDAGSEYTSARYTQTLAMEGLVPSIGAYDNALPKR